MAKLELAGKAQTVLGLVDPDDLGVTLTHEHLFIAHGRANFIEPSAASEKSLAYKPVSIEILSWLRYHPPDNVDNMNMLDEQEAIDEAMRLQQCSQESELVALELRGAVEELSAIASPLDNEEVLDIIFGQFCIGK